MKIVLLQIPLESLELPWGFSYKSEEKLFVTLSWKSYDFLDLSPAMKGLRKAFAIDLAFLFNASLRNNVP
ncbi:hypothetical protein OUZ56_008880 [Daphnia magna]|uniref:Uncharacterized protein n=1 Tax=Daphnia magna TaxID=35525 RepID=A0ABR0AER1_9CRUS|nr:hypothetical protein OUZ56_008880 [Daphnia magna]